MAQTYEIKTQNSYALICKTLCDAARGRSIFRTCKAMCKQRGRQMGPVRHIKTRGKVVAGMAGEGQACSVGMGQTSSAGS